MALTGRKLLVPISIVFCASSPIGCSRPPDDMAGSGGIDFTDAGSGSDSGPSESDGEKFDLSGGETDGGEGGGDCPGGGKPDDGYDFSIIWIANSPEGTVSKIDTETATELARYRTGPDAPDPSRTSVNLRGDVAIANRAGSVTKIAARLEDCVDSNNDGAIQTSQGPSDILAWGSDECVLWHHDVDFPQGLSSNQGGPRAIAWDAGKPGANTCLKKPNLWVGWRDQPNDVARIRRLDGATGEPLGEVDVPDWQGNWGHGTYGGAADAAGGFWGLGTLGTLVYVDPMTLSVTRWDNPDDTIPYGMALDSTGMPWLGAYTGELLSFERSTEQWNNLGKIGSSKRLRGLAIDGKGHAWIAGNDPCALLQYDITSNTVVNGEIALPGCDEPVGVSIDARGFVWVVDRGASTAFKVDPDDYTTITVGGLVGPYTYSDMTGAGLDLVVNPPQG